MVPVRPSESLAAMQSIYLAATAGVPGMRAGRRSLSVLIAIDRYGSDERRIAVPAAVGYTGAGESGGRRWTCQRSERLHEVESDGWPIETRLIRVQRADSRRHVDPQSEGRLLHRETPSAG
jgi:hypothetical protein